MSIMLIHCDNRCVTALKDVSSQLGPIGVTIQTKLANTTEPQLREVLTQQKQLALELYDKLQVSLRGGEGGVF